MPLAIVELWNRMDKGLWISNSSGDDSTCDDRYPKVIDNSRNLTIDEPTPCEPTRIGLCAPCNSIGVEPK